MSDSPVDDPQASHVKRAYAHTVAMRGDARALADELRGAVTELEARVDLSGRLERSPYLTLAAVAGVGYVLGGGLFSRLSGRALRMAVRLVMVPMIREELLGLTEDFSTAIDPGAPRDP